MTGGETRKMPTDHRVMRLHHFGQFQASLQKSMRSTAASTGSHMLARWFVWRRKVLRLVQLQTTLQMRSRLKKVAARMFDLVATKAAEAGYGGSAQEFGDATFRDPETGLEWQRCPIGTTPGGAGGTERCEGKPVLRLISTAIAESGLVKAGWRLPTGQEVISLRARLSGVYGDTSMLGEYFYQPACNSIRDRLYVYFPRKIIMLVAGMTPMA